MHFTSNLPNSIHYTAVLYCTDRLHDSSTLLYFTVTFCWCIVVYFIVLYCTVLYFIVLYCIVFFCTVLYYILLNVTVFYCILLYFNVLYCNNRIGSRKGLLVSMGTRCIRQMLYWRQPKETQCMENAIYCVGSRN